MRRSEGARAASRLDRSRRFVLPPVDGRVGPREDPGKGAALGASDVANMDSILLTLALALCLSAPAPAVCTGSDETTRQAFAAAAGQIHTISYDRVMYSREYYSPFRRDSQLLADLIKRHDAPESPLPLPADPAPKVRTLAMLVLYHREDPRLLPRFVELVGDSAVTFPEPHPMAAPQGRDVRVDARTVGACARKLVDNYMRK